MPKPFESWIQDLVYNVDVGIGLRLTKFALGILFLVGLVVTYQASEFKGFDEREAMDQAQLARNLATRGKWVTQNIRPASLWYLRHHHPSREPRFNEHPDILHPPLYSALLAGAFKLLNPTFEITGPHDPFRPESLIILPLNHLFSLLVGLFVYLFGRRLFDRRVALMALITYFVTNAVWAESISGSTVPLATLLSVIALYAASRAVEHRQSEEEPVLDLKSLCLSVCGCALAFLTRYATVVIVPCIMLYIALSLRRKSWVWVTGFAVVFLLAVSPWLIRNKMVSGGFFGLTPYTALNETFLFGARDFERAFNPVLQAGAVFRALLVKWLGQASRFYDHELRLVGGGFFVSLFAASFFYRFVRDDVHRFRWCILLAVALLVLVAGFFGAETIRLLHIFLPVVLVYGSAFFFLLLDRLQLRVRIFDYAVIFLTVLLAAIPLIVTLLPPRANRPYPPYFPPYIVHVTKLLGGDEFLCTDMPWATAWYGNRNSIELPVTLEEFYDINDYHQRINGLYFTTLTRNKPYIRGLVSGPYRSWFPILEGRIPADFPLTQGFPLGPPDSNLDQLFLTDRKRWGK